MGHFEGIVNETPINVKKETAAMNKTKIDWQNPLEGWKLDCTVNPSIGCPRDCVYCYAKRMNRRFKWIENWTEPEYFPKSLNALSRHKKPSTVFIGSVSDIFYWPEWLIDDTIKMCEKASWHRYMFLTKSPSIYENWDFPSNCWLGFTAEIPSNEVLKSSIDHLSASHNKTFLSIEPLAGMGCKIPEGIDLVIVGAMTGPKAIEPQKEWIESIKHPNIHYKSNIRKYL